MSIFYIILIAVIIISVVKRYLGQNEDYTRGSNIFKSSEHNLENNEKKDISDYDYYNTDGKSK